MNDENLKDPPLQQILNEQGYLILFFNESVNLKPGTVISRFNGGIGYKDFEGPVVVMGPASQAEWRRQCQRYGGFCITEDLPGRSCVKVICE